jgi:D-3-phosphoglycerate dehydrogenase / 2-oxoglutarate reductase
MLVLIADKLPATAVGALRELGLGVDARADLRANDLPEALAQTGAGILVVRSTEVSAAAFDAAPNLSLVIRAGAGVNTIDLDAASRHGVFVANCPGKNAIAVAELTMGLILALDRRIPEAVADLRDGRWRKSHYGRADGLHGKRLGLLGFGPIAREVAIRARAFGMHVDAYARTLTSSDAAAHGAHAVGSLDELVRTADILSVHVPYSKTTHHIVGARELGAMKDGALVIHTARGGVVDDAALQTEVARGRLRAGLDVFEDEPSGGDDAFEHPLRALDGIYGTPHIGASTDQAQAATADEVVRIVQSYLESGTVPNVVNVLEPRPARWTLVVRHRDRVGVLAGILGVLREESLNVQEMQNVIFVGNEAASATITLAHEPSPRLVDRLREQEDILAVDLREVR